MPMDAWRVECQTCDWTNWNADRGAVKHSGYVHAEILSPGHVVGSLVHLPGGWVR
jgi:hypothetical protein